MDGGFSLLEVLIAFLLLSIVTLGVLNVTAIVNKSNYASYAVNVANIQLNNLRNNFLVGAGEDYFPLWNQVNAKILPNGVGSYKKQHDSYQISLCWSDRAFGKRCLFRTVN